MSIGGDWLKCPECRYEEEVSEEDPDASFSEILRHVRRQHPGVNTAPAVLWPRIDLVTH